MERKERENSDGQMLYHCQLPLELLCLIDMKEQTFKLLESNAVELAAPCKIFVPEYYYLHET